MTEGGHTASRAQFEANLIAKRAFPAFREDVEPLLRPDIPWNFDEAFAVVMNEIIARLPGDSWKGEGG